MERREKLQKVEMKNMRAWRTRRKIKTVGSLPRLSVFRSLKHFYLQIIDDTHGKTLCSARDTELKDVKNLKGQEVATKVGELIAQKAVVAKVEQVVFDRGSYKYHGRVKAAAEAARKGGLKF